MALHWVQLSEKAKHHKATLDEDETKWRILCTDEEAEFDSAVHYEEEGDLADQAVPTEARCKKCVAIDPSEGDETEDPGSEAEVPKVKVGDMVRGSFLGHGLTMRHGGGKVLAVNKDGTLDIRVGKVPGYPNGLTIENCAYCKDPAWRPNQTGPTKWWSMLTP